MLPVTVVIPLYNTARHVVRAVESVRAQTWPSWQLIVVDDGSTDNGAGLVEALADSRITLIRSTNRGPGAARNIGIRACDTEWVALLDADDEWDPTFLEATLAAAQGQHDLVAVFSAVTARSRAPRAPRHKEGRVHDYFDALTNDGAGITASSVIIRRSTFLEIGAFAEDDSYAEDTEAWFRLVCAGDTYFVPRTLSYIETGESESLTRATSAANKAAGLQSLLATYQRYRDAGMIPPPMRQSARRFIEIQSARTAMYLARAGESMSALRWLLKATALRRHTWRPYRAALGAIAKSVFARKSHM